MTVGRVAVLNALLLPAHALICGPALGVPPRPPTTSARRAAVHGCAVEAEEVLVTSDGGVRKRVLQAAPAGALPPKWGAMVRVSYTATFDNGTVFERHGPDNPFEFQLNTGQVIDGLARGVAAMCVGERAALTCAPEWGHGSLGLPPHIPGDETLRYTLELVGTSEGPQVENPTPNPTPTPNPNPHPTDFDIHACVCARYTYWLTMATLTMAILTMAILIWPYLLGRERGLRYACVPQRARGQRLGDGLHARVPLERGRRGGDGSSSSSRSSGSSRSSIVVV